METPRKTREDLIDKYEQALATLRTRLATLDNNPEPEDKTKAYALVYSGTILDVLQYSKAYSDWYSLHLDKPVYWDAALLTEMENATIDTLAVVPLNIP